MMRTNLILASALALILSGAADVKGSFSSGGGRSSSSFSSRSSVTSSSSTRSAPASKTFSSSSYAPKASVTPGVSNTPRYSSPPSQTVVHEHYYNNGGFGNSPFFWLWLFDRPAQPPIVVNNGAATAPVVTSGGVSGSYAVDNTPGFWTKFFNVIFGLLLFGVIVAAVVWVIKHFTTHHTMYR